VWKRDGGRCGFVSKDGRRCTARGQLEYHHVRPNGEPTVDNIQLRCRAHNLYEADLFYGASRSGRDQVGGTTEPSFSSRKPTGSGASKTYNADQLAPALPATPKGASTRLSNSRNLSLWGGGT
jgi:hypothetical protein